jgi:hypothetical protein
MTFPLPGSGGIPGRWRIQAMPPASPWGAAGAAKLLS